jgi:hypothetical protein
MTVQLERQYEAPAVTPPHEATVTPLDEMRDFIAQFIDATGTQLDAIAAWIVHTHVLQAFPATPRLLLTGDMECGKSESLRRIRDLSANGWSAKATKDALRAKLDCPRDARPTIIVDEISDVFGKSGRTGSQHPLGTILRLGYKVGETDSFTSARVAEEIDIFAAAAMAGRGNAVPDDIRGRSVAIRMRNGTPAVDYTVREHDPMAAMLSNAVGRYFRRYLGELERFRARGIHPKLTGRRREIWEPLFAVAHVAGGSWPQRILQAFQDLVLDQSDNSVLTPKQTVIRDVQRAAHLIGGDEIAGRDIIAALRGFREPLYEGMVDRSLAMFIASATDPVKPGLLSRAADAGGKQARGYLLADIERIAAERLPADPAADEDDSDEQDDDDSLTIFDVAETTETTDTTSAP